MRKTEQNTNQEGSPTTKPCTNSEMSGTAKEQSAAGQINTTDAVAAPADTPIKAGPVPLYLVPQTISSEIHAHGGEISEIAVKRTGQHVYAITLTKAGKKTQKRNQKQHPKRDQKQGTVQGTTQTKTTRPRPGQHAGGEGADGDARDAGDSNAA